MSLSIQDKVIEKVRLIDDDQGVRQSYKFQVEELNIATEEVFGPIVDVPSLLAMFNAKHDAVICDFNLKVKNYSSMNGDEIVSGLYKKNVPVVLCTRAEHLPEAIRRRRRHIPVVLSPSNLSPETLIHAFGMCVEEFKGDFSSIRKPWRTILRIEGGELLGNNDLLQVNAVIPEWDPSTLISFEWLVGENEALQKVRESVSHGDIVRIYATVNVGADGTDDLYVEDWSLRKIQ
jgi:CheY-like chemotaxis protein